MSRVLVSGAGGFIGRRVVQALRARSHEVIAAVRQPHPGSPGGVETVPLDLTNASTIRALPKPVDAVVHAAAARLEGFADWPAVERLVHVNALGTLRMLAYAQGCGARRLVYCSTLSIYALPQPVPIREEGATDPAGSADGWYALSKLTGELLCQRAHQEGRMGCVSLRLARVFGSEEPAGTLLNAWVRDARQGRPLVVRGDGQRSLDFLYVDDAVRAIVAAVECSQAQGVINVGSGRETTWRELAEAVVDVFSPPDRGSAIRYVPEGDRSRCCLDISRAKAMLGLAPSRTLREGLIAWRLDAASHEPVHTGARGSEVVREAVA